MSTYVYGAADAKISPLVSETGGTPVYGVAKDVPGLQSIEVKTKSDTKELRGDNQLLAKISNIQSVEVTLKFAKWDLEIFSILTGAEYDEDRVTLKSNSTPGYFKLEGVSAQASGSGSNADVFFPKLIVTELPDMIGLSEEDFKTVTVTCEALPLADGTWIEAGYNATAKSL